MENVRLFEEVQARTRELLQDPDWTTDGGLTPGFDRRCRRSPPHSPPERAGSARVPHGTAVCRRPISRVP